MVNERKKNKKWLNPLELRPDGKSGPCFKGRPRELPDGAETINAWSVWQGRRITGSCSFFRTVSFCCKTTTGIQVFRTRALEFQFLPVGVVCSLPDKWADQQGGRMRSSVHETSSSIITLAIIAGRHAAPPPRSLPAAPSLHECVGVQQTEYFLH